MFYSASTGGFYAVEIHGDSMPTDVVEITEGEYADMLAGQAVGQEIVPDVNGRPVLQSPPPPPPPNREQVEAARLRAYADSITGSDRYFAEAQRESLLGNAEAAEAAKALGLARFAEIQADNPWPAE